MKKLDKKNQVILIVVLTFVLLLVSIKNFRIEYSYLFHGWKSSSSLKNFDYIQNAPVSISISPISSATIIVDKKNNSLIYFDRIEDYPKEFKTIQLFESEIELSLVSRICFNGRDDKVVLVARDQIFLLNLNNNELEDVPNEISIHFGMNDCQTLASGRIIVGGGGGMYFFDDDGWTSIENPELPEYYQIVEDDEGEIWIALYDGRVFKLVNEDLILITDLKEAFSIEGITDMYSISSGEFILRIGNKDLLLFSIDNNIPAIEYILHADLDTTPFLTIDKLHNRAFISHEGYIMVLDIQDGKVKSVNESLVFLGVDRFQVLVCSSECDILYGITFDGKLLYKNINN